MLAFWFVFLLHAALPTLVGRVSDNKGKPVSHADVLLTTSDGTSKTYTTNDRGSFRAEVAGQFQLEIRHEGFRSVRSSKVQLPNEGAYHMEIALNPGEPDDVESVDLQLDQFDDIQNRADPSAREALPKSDRLFGLRGGVNVSGIKEGSGEQWLATTGNVFTNSSLATSVSSNSDFSAALGDSTAVDDTLPPGDDVFHGNVHYFHRNDRLNAHNFFDLPNSEIPPFKYNFFGGDSGGRLRPGTYLYMQYWGLRIRQSITRGAITPNPAWLEGDFSGVAEPLLDPETGFDFPDKRIPKSRFDPTGYAFARSYPAPNFSDGKTAQNYRAVAKLRTAADAFGFRVDHRVTASNETYLEYQFNRDTTDDPFNLLSGITNLPFYGVRDALETHSMRLNNAHVFSPTLVHQLRFSFAYLKQPRTILGATPQPAILMVGISHLGHAANLPQERRNRSFELSNDFSWHEKDRTTKFGGELRYFPFHASMDLYSRGQYQFTNGIFSSQAFANLLLGLPTNALRIQGDTTRDFRTWTSSFYFERNWQLAPQLTATAGMRYHYQSPFSEAQGRVANFDPVAGVMKASPDRLYRPDRNNFAPRLGLAWKPPLKDALVRVGYGVFYDTLAVGDSLFFLGLNPPFVRFDLENNGPVVPLFTLDTAFKTTNESVHPSVFSTSPELPNPYAQQWNLSVEKLLPGSFVLVTGYYGQKGTRLRRQINLNQPPAGPPGSLDERRPYPDFRNIFQFETSAKSIAHAGDIQVSRRFGARFSFDAGYRFSRMIDDATLISVLPQDSHNLKGERGLADFHAKHRFSFEATAMAPAIRFLKGWQFHAIGLMQSGTPLSAVLDADVAGTGYPIVNRPDLIHDPSISNPTAERYFDKTAFESPQIEHFGNSGRNVIIGPGLSNIDVALSRAFRVTDFSRMQFRADVYNVFNHPNFVAPPSMQNFMDTDGFGALFVARSPRIIQLGLKFLW